MIKTRVKPERLFTLEDMNTVTERTLKVGVLDGMYKALMGFEMEIVNGNPVLREASESVARRDYLMIQIRELQDFMIELTDKRLRG